MKWGANVSEVHLFRGAETWVGCATSRKRRCSSTPRRENGPSGNSTPWSVYVTAAASSRTLPSGLLSQKTRTATRKEGQVPVLTSTFYGTNPSCRRGLAAVRVASDLCAVPAQACVADRLHEVPPLDLVVNGITTRVERTVCNVRRAVLSRRGFDSDDPHD